MSQSEKNKKNAIVSHMSKKSRIKKKYRNKESDKVTGPNHQSNRNIDDRRDIDENNWFTDQYEKLIGKPLSGTECSTDEVLRQLQKSTKYRWIPEANNYKSYNPQPGNVHYFEWKDPMAKVCQCPDNDCICSGSFMLPRKRIPRGERYIKSPWIRKLLRGFRKSASLPNENFVQRLAAAVGVETAVYHDLENNGILNIRGAEFCMARCIKYYGPGHMPSSKTFSEKEKLQSCQTPSLKKEKDEDDDRIYDGSSYTVSPQATVAPTGESMNDNFSHVHSTLSKAVLRDIEGTELQITSYNSVSEDYEHKSNHICSFDKLFNLRELINMKKLKNQISLLKKNIYSSIFEIREKTSSVRISTTQHEEEHEIKEGSSEVVTIPTPYKGLMLKAKKKPHESLTEGRLSGLSQAVNKTIGETLLEPLNLNVPNIQNSEKDIPENLQVRRKIEVTKFESGKKIEIQRQKISKELSMKFIDPNIRTICDPNPNEPNKYACPLPIQSIHIANETVKKSINTENHRDIFEKIAESTNHFKLNNVLHGFSSQSGNSKNNIINKTQEIGIHRKQNNNFVNNGISMDQLQNINMKKFKKCLSYDNGVLFNRNYRKENRKCSQAEGNISLYGIDETKSKKKCSQTISEKEKYLRSLSIEGTKIKNLDSNLLLKCKMKHKDLNQIETEEVKLDQNINTFNTEDNCNKLPYDLSLKSANEREFLKSLNTNVPQPVQETETYSSNNQVRILEETTSTNLEFKTDSNSKYKKISKHTEWVEQPLYENTKENLPRHSKKGNLDVSLTLENAIVKARLLNKKVSNLSSMLKKILHGKMYISVKSLPVYRNFRKSHQAQKNAGKTERKTYIKNSKEEYEEPKTSEREMFSIKYSAISEMKCSSNFLNIEPESYPMTQEVQDIRSSVPVEIRRLTA